MPKNVIFLSKNCAVQIVSVYIKNREFYIFTTLKKTLYYINIFMRFFLESTRFQFSVFVFVW